MKYEYVCKMFHGEILGSVSCTIFVLFFLLFNLTYLSWPSDSRSESKLGLPLRSLVVFS